MRTFTKEELSEIIEKHKKWIRGEEDGERANLHSANLSYADLRYADLSYADLSYADLSYADLRYADLSYADLRYADLSYAIGDSNFVKSMQVEKYYISYTSNKLNIGCQSHTIKEWQEFSDEAISEMDGGALEWWKIWKPIIMQIIELSPAKEPEQKDDR